jgi:hypothetical protein
MFFPVPILPLVFQNFYFQRYGGNGYCQEFHSHPFPVNVVLFYKFRQCYLNWVQSVFLESPCKVDGLSPDILFCCERPRILNSCCHGCTVECESDPIITLKHGTMCQQRGDIISLTNYSSTEIHMKKHVTRTRIRHLEAAIWYKSY